MATNWLTNRAKLEIVQGYWDEAGATDIRIGLIDAAAIPAAADTEAEIQDLNFVDAFLALTGVDEVTASGYARQNLSRTNWAEDDTDNRAEADTGNVTFSAVATGANIMGFFVYRFVTNDADSPLWCVAWFDTATPTNGSDIVITVTDLIRAT